jgi:hypothetical protein
VVLTYSDISAEFEGLPHADEFVRTVRSLSDIRAIMSEMAAAGNLRSRFLAFKEACMVRYDWNACLKPLGDAVEACVTRRRSE